jgi:hypothetical protein
VDEHLAITERVERLAGEELIGRFRLLQAKDVRRPLCDKPPNIVDPQPDRVDIPCDQTKSQGPAPGTELRNCSGAENIGARSGGKTGRLHVRSVWGKSGPQGRRDRFKEGLLTLSASE